jgi:DNA-binding transcriptional regulator YiaG
MNLASVLKSEISRVARKEVRSEIESLKKASSQYRSEIAALKRRALQLERLVTQLNKSGRMRAVAAAADEPATVLRYSGKNLAAQRKRLGLSAADFGLLLGVSGASIYKWEEGSTRPRASQMPGIAAVRKLSKPDAVTRLAELK